MAKPEAGLTGDNQKFFCFGMMIMPTPSNTRVRGEVRKLPRILGFEHFHENTSGVSVFRNLVRKIFRWQVTKISRVQSPHEPSPHPFGNHRLSTLFKGVQLRREFSYGNRVTWLDLYKRITRLRTIHH
ncbi:hypothetical protein D3C81_1351600 [compost metagenome]